MVEAETVVEHYADYAADWAQAEAREPNFDMDQHVEAAWKWWRELGAPKHVVAPMVDASELPWRVLSRRYGKEFSIWKSYSTVISYKT